VVQAISRQLSTGKIKKIPKEEILLARDVKVSTSFSRTAEYRYRSCSLTMYEGRSKSFASRYVRLKKLFKIYTPITHIFLPNSYEFKVDVTSL